MRKTDDVFQERLDELLTIEQKMELRTQEFQQKASDALGRLNALEEKISNDLVALKEISNTTNQHTQKLAKINRNSIFGFIAILAIVGVILGGAYLWFGYIQWQINVASLKLYNLDLKLSSTPEIIKYHGDDYIRIIPHTASSFNNRNGEYTGDYAKVWYDKRRLNLKGD